MSWTANPKTFSAAVTILGKARGVAYDGDSLIITDMTAQEALSLLDGISASEQAQPAVAPQDRKPAPASAASEPARPAAPTLAPVTAVAILTPAPATSGEVPVGGKPPRKPMPPLTEEQKAKRVAALAKAREVKAQKLAAAKVPATEVVNTESQEEGSHTAETGLNRPVPAATPAPAPSDDPEDYEEDLADDKAEQAATKAANAAGDPAADAGHATKLAGLSKIGEVVSYLHDAGFHSVADKIALCGRVRDRVPVLQRVPNLDERIGRAQEVMGLDG